MRAVKLDGLEITTGLDFTNPYTYLATMVIFRAVIDANLLGQSEYRRMDGENVSKYELLNFFRSKWCSVLISFQDSITHQQVTDRMERLLFPQWYHKVTEQTSQKNKIGGVQNGNQPQAQD